MAKVADRVCSCWALCTSDFLSYGSPPRTNIRHDIHKPSPYLVLTWTQSQAIIAGPQIFVSGQIPADTKGNLIEGSIADKTKQCCENIVGILTEAGVAIDRVVKVRLPLPIHSP